VRALIDLLVTDACESTARRIQELGLRSAEDVRRAPKNAVCFSSDLQARKDDLQKYLFEHVYQHYRVARMAHKAKHFIERLFRAYVAQPRQLPPDYQDWAKQEGLHQAVCDYIAGMTDRYAQDEYLKLFSPYERV